MASKKGRSGNAWKNGYSRYKAENRHAKNKIRRLRKYIMKNPNDEQAKSALSRLEKEVKYTRNHARGKTQSAHDRRLDSTIASVERGATHRATFGKNESTKPSPTDIRAQLIDLYSLIFADKVDRKILRK